MEEKEEEREGDRERGKDDEDAALGQAIFILHVFHSFFFSFFSSFSSESSCNKITPDLSTFLSLFYIFISLFLFVYFHL